MNYLCYWMPLSQFCRFAFTHAMTWILSFARVRTDREQKIRDGHVPQQLDEKLTVIRTPSREFRNQSSDFRWPRRPSSQEKENAQRIEHHTLSG